MMWMHGQGRTAAAPVFFCGGGGDGGVVGSPAAACSFFHLCHHGPADRSMSSWKIADDHLPSMSSVCVVPFSAGLAGQHTGLGCGMGLWDVVRTELDDHLRLPLLLLRLERLVHVDVDRWVRVSYPRKVLLREVPVRELKTCPGCSFAGLCNVPCAKVIIPVGKGQPQALQVREDRTGLLFETCEDNRQPGRPGNSLGFPRHDIKGTQEGKERRTTSRRRSRRRDLNTVAYGRLQKLWRCLCLLNSKAVGLNPLRRRHDLVSANCMYNASSA